MGLDGEWRYIKDIKLLAKTSERWATQNHTDVLPRQALYQIANGKETLPSGKPAEPFNGGPPPSSVQVLTVSSVPAPPLTATSINLRCTFGGHGSDSIPQSSIVNRICALSRLRLGS